MKRNPHLQPLSHDHHQGLVFTRNLREGLNEHADPEVLREYATSFWKRHTRDHFELEEAHLLPLLRHLRASRLAWQLQKEHEQIANLLEQLRTPHPTMRTTLSVLAEVLTQHIRFEEQEVFPFLENHLEDEILLRVGAYLHQAQDERDDEMNELETLLT